MVQQADTQKIVTKTGVEDAGDENEQHTSAQTLQLQAGDPRSNGLDENCDSGYDNQCSLKAGGERVFAPGSHTKMPRGWASAEAETIPGKAHGDDVNDRLGSIREDGN